MKLISKYRGFIYCFIFSAVIAVLQIIEAILDQGIGFKHIFTFWQVFLKALLLYFILTSTIVGFYYWLKYKKEKNNQPTGPKRHTSKNQK
jgi:hypothetical protein